MAALDDEPVRSEPTRVNPLPMRQWLTPVILVAGGLILYFIHDWGWIRLK
jgi:hypothetical protein